MLNLYWTQVIGVFLVAGGLGLLAGFFVTRRAASRLVSTGEKERARILEEARVESDRLRGKAEAELKAEWEKERLKFETQTATTRRELERLEAKLTEREAFVSRRDSVITQKEADLIRKDRDVLSRDKIVRAKMERIDQLIAQENTRLERVANLSADDARRELLKNMENQVRLEAAQMAKDIKEEARQRAESEARDIIIQAIQRCAVSHAAETTVSVVNLPSDELKGRIIGREGRNIRTFETMTGVEVMIDDTPGAIIISGFDPIRREVAKLAMEKLVTDGRIHPARIEEVVAKTREEMNGLIKTTGEAVVLELGIVGLNAELVKLLGRLKFRTSYGQNVLLHSKEVAYLAGLMAQELDLDAALARRAGLLHDIGKAADQSVEGTHSAIGAELAQRHGEVDTVVNAIAAHHEEATIDSPYAFLVSAADSVSSSRPGARRESFETYIQRVEGLEAIAASFDGVEKAYAIQAGREIRVLVEPDKVADRDAGDLAAKVAAQIQAEMKYPGQIKVTVIRETRAVDYAH
jgi:ribonuclease Y